MGLNFIEDKPKKPTKTKKKKKQQKDKSVDKSENVDSKTPPTPKRNKKEKQSTKKQHLNITTKNSSTSGSANNTPISGRMGFNDKQLMQMMEGLAVKSDSDDDSIVNGFKGYVMETNRLMESQGKSRISILM